METIIEHSMSDIDVKYLESQATPEEVAQAEFFYDVILCSPTFGNAVPTGCATSFRSTVLGLEREPKRAAIRLLEQRDSVVFRCKIMYTLRSI